MFKLFRKKASIFAPVAGKNIALENVDDVFFSKGFFGDGIAITPNDNIIKAPCDGILSLITKTKHAFIIDISKDIQILVHFGIDTICLNGEGFETLANMGGKVSKGSPIIKVDNELLIKKGIDLTTIMVVTTPKLIKNMVFTQKESISLEDEVFGFTY